MRFLSTLAASVLGTLIAVGALLLFVFFFIFAISLSADTTPQVQRSTILTLDIQGPIPERVSKDPFTRAIADQPKYDVSDVLSALSKAEKDDRISGLWIRLKGTQASWATLEQIRNAITAFRDSGKPVIASSGDFGMIEKDYFLASAADSIYAGPVTAFEFNGFYLPQTFFKGTLDKLGIEPKVVRAGQYKSAIETFTRNDLSEENEEQLQAIIDTQYDVFLNAIADSRSIDEQRLRDIASTDAPMDVRPAKDLGMIDDVRYTDEVVDVLRGIVGVSPSDDVRMMGIDDYARVPSSDVGLETTGDGRVAVIYGTGQIVPGDDDGGAFGSSGMMASDPIIEAFENARENESIKAIVFRVDSPGGSAAASEAIWRAVKRTKEVKPVIVSMGNLAASGGYYVAAPADTIVASPSTITGSIGVFGLLFNVEGLLTDKLGVGLDNVSTSDLADMYSPFSDFSEQERTLLASSIDRTYQTFLQRVAEGRKMSVEAVDSVAQGRVWTGRDAQEAGLVDVLGGLSEAVRIAGEKGGLGEGPYAVQTLPRQKTFFEKLNEDLSSQAARVYFDQTASDLERQMQAKRDRIRYYLSQSGTVQAVLPYEIDIQ
ncbi:signal peptide peptidase SppA [Longibacter salinarum]|uniref:Signal peptide peptidase SppA n=1 Tax=Longibacter salinarum TaxID=1850348 RepID=A0A2A8D3F4_9BACT|nr:signal peptide peptidase SppA [Longibacter salinarum]PEN15333.1 signal peptide peptidase SppA [Longibacter salinarum]